MANDFDDLTGAMMMLLLMMMMYHDSQWYVQAQENETVMNDDVMMNHFYLHLMWVPLMLMVEHHLIYFSFHHLSLIEHLSIETIHHIEIHIHDAKASNNSLLLTSTWDISRTTLSHSSVSIAYQIGEVYAGRGEMLHTASRRASMVHLSHPSVNDLSITSQLGSGLIWYDMVQ
jgi:hypothetical protein